MTLQASGFISASDIRDEFDQAGTMAMSDYYRDGGIVPAGVDTSVPLSGAISFSNFYGVSNEIEPTYAIGEKFFEETDTRTYTGNGSYSTRWDETWEVPALWIASDYKFSYTATSTANYITFGYRVKVYINDVSINTWSEDASNSGYFRYNSGSRSHNNTYTLAAGDTIRMLIQGIGRNVGGTTPSSTLSYYLQRVT